MSVERVPSGALKLTSRGGAALYASSMGDAPTLRLGPLATSAVAALLAAGWRLIPPSEQR